MSAAPFLIPAPEVVEIPVTGSTRPALVDARDAERVRGMRWRINRQGIVHASIATGTVLLKRFVLGLNSRAPGVCVRHINGDRLDCRRSNLKTGSHRAACHNPALANRADKSSRYNGVRKESNRWVAQTTLNRVLYQLGRWDTEEDAARAYDRFIRANGLPEDCCNFPPDVPSLMEHFGND